MKIAVGCDSFGHATKQAVLQWLQAHGHQVEDMGAFSSEPDEKLCDYADAVCEAVVSGKAERGVLVCGTGVAMGIRANRWPGIAAMVCHNPKDAAENRKNDAINVLVFRGFYETEEGVAQALEGFLNTPFEPSPRRERRLVRMDAPTGGPWS